MIHTGDEVYVIAEIGKNFIQHNQEFSVEHCLENAIKLVDAAVECGVNAVKFQTHEVEDEQMNVDVVSPHFREMDRYDWVLLNTKLTPLTDFWVPLKKHCDDRRITFLSTPMSRKAARKLSAVGVSAWKIGSGDIQDYALLDYVMGTNLPIIISTGMVSKKELREVIDLLHKNGSDITVLYCVSEYPAPKEHFNLSNIEYLKENYPDMQIGFSDHSLGYEVSLSAIKLGAALIEKHFSLSRDFWGSDHKVSMVPEEMKQMVTAIKNKEYEKIDPRPYLGQKEKEFEGANSVFRKYFNKSLVAGRDIKKGEIIDKNAIFAMRPIAHINGLPSNRFYDVVGTDAKKDIKKNEAII